MFIELKQIFGSQSGLENIKMFATLIHSQFSTTFESFGIFYEYYGH